MSVASAGTALLLLSTVYVQWRHFPVADANVTIAIRDVHAGWIDTSFEPLNINCTATFVITRVCRFVSMWRSEATANNVGLLVDRETFSVRFLWAIRVNCKEQQQINLRLVHIGQFWWRFALCGCFLIRLFHSIHPATRRCSACAVWTSWHTTSVDLSRGQQLNFPRSRKTVVSSMKSLYKYCRSAWIICRPTVLEWWATLNWVLHKLNCLVLTKVLLKKRGLAKVMNTFIRQTRQRDRKRQIIN